MRRGRSAAAGARASQRQAQRLEEGELGGARELVGFARTQGYKPDDLIEIIAELR